jgi:hypothetical protein
MHAEWQSRAGNAGHWVDRRNFPSAEDMRMVRAIALLALFEAAKHGAYHASFRRFRVEAKRQDSPAGGAMAVEIRVCVGFEDVVFEDTRLSIPAVFAHDGGQR